jgi:phosphopantetheinyl transferase
MPLIYYRSHAGAEVALWEATEPLSFYRDSLVAQDFPIESGDKIKHPEKALQWFASRYLLSVMFPQAIQLYNKRKPLLFNGPEISFSHSKTTVAVMLSQKSTGIDIQWSDPKLLTIMARFTTAWECGLVQGKSHLNVLALVWAVKEAVFKKYGTSLPFLEIKLTHYDPVADETTVAITRNGKPVQHLLATPYLGELALAYLIE